MSPLKAGVNTAPERYGGGGGIGSYGFVFLLYFLPSSMGFCPGEAESRWSPDVSRDDQTDIAGNKT